MLAEHVVQRLRGHLERLYGDAGAVEALWRLVRVLEKHLRAHPRQAGESGLFDESDVVVIAYGDQVSEEGVPPLRTLHRFLGDHAGEVVTGLHLLPHYPATSDDGFAVADYSAVDPALGTWEDVERLGGRFRLMLDAVVNHTSASHPWFRGWLAGDPAYDGFYLAVDADTDLAGVTRPRTTPLLTPFDGVSGPRRVWTTFSPDQVDLNYADPRVLVAVTEQLLRYVAHGARMLRLDAVAFLWKQPGTSCIHLPQTHEVIRLWRTVLDAVAPGALLVTETNVPHAENVTYFGDGHDEAHLVYQFALPPLTLAAFHTGDTTTLREWARELTTPSERTTFLNFLASHDGIGLRPVEGILPSEEVDRLGATVAEQGGLVSYRAGEDGRSRPYELNSVYLDALRLGPGEPPDLEIARFLAAHSIQLALAGVPLLYFHSLVGSRNWHEGVERTGQPRAVNRERFSRAGLEAELTVPGSFRRRVLDGMLGRIATRTADPAFHPNAAQHVLDAGPRHFAVQRTPRSGGHTVVCVHDVSGRAGRVRVRPRDRLPAGTLLRDLVDGSEHTVGPGGLLDLTLPGYGVRWLRSG